MYPVFPLEKISATYLNTSPEALQASINDSGPVKQIMTKKDSHLSYIPWKKFDGRLTFGAYPKKVCEDSKLGISK